MDIDIHKSDKRLASVRKNIVQSDISPENKDLLLDFGEDCLTGWKIPRVSKTRVVTLLQRTKILTLAINKNLLLFDERDSKKLLLWMDEKYPLPDGAWSQHSYRLVIRKFITWMRHKYGYPEGYPNREKLTTALAYSKFAHEVSHIDAKKPDRLKDAQLIPTNEEMDWLCEAAVNHRDRAYMEMSREHGERIGGLGSRQMKHIKFDGVGALVVMHDKTFRGEPVRYLTSSMYLRQWVDNHPFKDNPEAPLWIDLSKFPDCVPLDYSGFRAIIKRLIERHNRIATKKGRSQINKKITTHLFRYYAQTRDEKKGMPRTIMCKLRGWKPGSKQPEQYARLTSEDVDDYLMKQSGLVVEKEECRQDNVVKCPRCKEINTESTKYCYKCGLPLSDDSVFQVEDTVEQTDKMLSELMKDSEFRDMLMKKVAGMNGVKAAV
jgi:hypothetical protein